MRSVFELARPRLISFLICWTVLWWKPWATIGKLPPAFNVILFGLMTLLTLWIVFCFLSVRFDSDSITKETPAAISRDGATPASKPSKGTKGRDVSDLSLSLVLNWHVTCLQECLFFAFLCCDVLISQSYIKRHNRPTQRTKCTEALLRVFTDTL